jgi:hypothetical protein
VSLTSGVLRALVAALTVALFAGLVLRWSLLAGPKPRAVLARAGMLLMVNLLVLLTVALQMNAKYLFFADWTDLHGALTGTVAKTSVASGGSAAAAADALVREHPSPLLRQLPHLPGGTVRTYTVKGPISGVTGTVTVELPPGYGDASAATRTYPVLEAFHGYPGLALQMIQSFDLGGEIAAQVKAKHMQSALIVAPQSEVPLGVDTECVNGSAGYPQVETWLAQDIPNWVAQHFRVRADRRSWATIGVSAGAWCAAMVAMLHPAQFGAGIILGGYFRPDFGAFLPYPERSLLAQRYDLVALAGRAPPPVALWLQTSHSDRVSYGTSAALLQAARAPLAVQAVILQHAGHRLGIFLGVLPDSLQWLGTNVSGFSWIPDATVRTG